MVLLDLYLRLRDVRQGPHYTPLRGNRELRLPCRVCLHQT